MRDVLFDFEGQVSAAGDRGGEFNVQGRLEEGTSCYEGVVFSVFPADVDVIFFHSGYEVSGQGQAQVVRGHSFGVYYGDVGGKPASRNSRTACLRLFCQSGKHGWRPVFWQRALHQARCSSRSMSPKTQTSAPADF